MRIASAAVAIGLIALMISIAGGGLARASRKSRSLRLKGSYAAIFSGQVNTSGGSIPIAGTGIFVADGHGNLSGHESYTLGTTPCEADISGTYISDSDGSGTDSIHLTASGQGCSDGDYTQSFAIAEHGRLVLLSNTNGDQVNEEWRSQK